MSETFCQARTISIGGEHLEGDAHGHTQGGALGRRETVVLAQVRVGLHVLGHQVEDGGDLRVDAFRKVHVPACLR